MGVSSLSTWISLLHFSAYALGKSPPEAFAQPPSAQVDSVDPLIGNGGDTPNSSGGMIPSTAPPFAMTRWVAQTRQNYVSMTPYNHTDTKVHGFQGTRQPAIWMGESGQVVVVPGAGTVKDTFKERGMTIDVDSQVITPSYYSVDLQALEGGKIFAEQSATSRVGHLRFTFDGTQTPYVLLSASRPTIIGSDDPSRATIIYPEGSASVSPEKKEICGWNKERQDSIIAPISTPAKGFKGYFCARFDTPFESWGVSSNGTVTPNSADISGAAVGAYATFGSSRVVEVRIGTSLISIERARSNLDKEIPDGMTLENTALSTRSAWAEKLDRIRIEGGTDEQRQIFYTGFFHALQYPYEVDEYGHYYSGYTDSVKEGISYNGYSIWDTYRAAWAWLIFFAPERVPDMITSMLQDYKEGGWLPMWKNVIETNIMVGTHADSLIAEAVVKGVKGFDEALAYEAVYKDATVPPRNDHNTSYSDREEGVDYEVRAGLGTLYAQKGYVANDIHSESGSRTLDYAYDDYAVAILGQHFGKPGSEVDKFMKRALTAPFTIFNNETGFMEARNANGDWAGETAGWTEGDKWAYSFDVVHDVDTLIAYRGGNVSFVESLDVHFDDGHNDHTNEPSHHIPYLYALAGRPDKTQEKVREIATNNYFTGPEGLTGNEDCGQMSAWYLFTALGLYPVNPVSGDYVVGSPFFSKVTIDLPGVKQPLVISAPGADKHEYIQRLTFNQDLIEHPIVSHDMIAKGGNLIFEMAGRPTTWGTDNIHQLHPDDDIERSEL